MSTTKQKEEQWEQEEELLQQIRAELTEVQARIGPRACQCFSDGRILRTI
jgi:hypothetical protein